MTREELIVKWLDYDLNPKELEAFKQLEEHDALVTLNDRIKRFEAPEYDVSNELDITLKRIQSHHSVTQRWWRTALKIAAIVVVALSVYYYTTTLDHTTTTFSSEKTALVLPDASEVMLNAASSVTFNKHTWSTERNINLSGEAYFKVTTGATFSIGTTAGTITVLGTEFNVKNRDGLFEVTCYEGSVKVNTAQHTAILTQGDRFTILDGEMLASSLVEDQYQPSWLDNKSTFISMPLIQVLKEFKRQYDTTIEIKNVDTTQKYTGSFVHDNKELALKSITLPLHLDYAIKSDGSIVLTRD